MENHATTHSGGAGPGPRNRRSRPPSSGRRRLALTFAAGALVAALLGATWPGGGQIQDPAVSQLRQELNNFKISLSNRLVRLESQVGQHDRDLTQVDRRLRDVERQQRDEAFLPRRDPPVPVAQEILDVRRMRAEGFLLRDEQGEVKAALTLRDGRPVLTLLGMDGEEMAVLEVTEEGAATLRLRDAGGILRTVALQ